MRPPRTRHSDARTPDSPARASHLYCTCETRGRSSHLQEPWGGRGTHHGTQSQANTTLGTLIRSASSTARSPRPLAGSGNAMPMTRELAVDVGGSEWPYNAFAADDAAHHPEPPVTPVAPGAGRALARWQILLATS